MMISKFTERLPFTQEQNRFLLVGFTAVFLDFLVYSGLQGLAPVSISTAKAGGFVAGAAFSYAVNGRYTFRQARLGMASLSRFIVLYLSTLAVNVVINDVCLALSGHGSIGFLAAFLAATGTSTVLNFLGMKFFVFTRA